jgi:hypothetical protein
MEPAESLPVQLGDICRYFGFRERDASYVLEQGFVPAGVDRKPVSGNHRQFGPGQAFWLVMVLKLKAVGIKPSVAAKIADHIAELWRPATQNTNWQDAFEPSVKSEDQSRYSVEVGDLTLIRFVREATPGGDREFVPWMTLGHGRFAVQDAEPFAIIQLDLSQITRHLVGIYRR